MPTHRVIGTRFTPLNIIITKQNQELRPVKRLRLRPILN